MRQAKTLFFSHIIARGLSRRDTFNQEDGSTENINNRILFITSACRPAERPVSFTLVSRVLCLLGFAVAGELLISESFGVLRWAMKLR